MNPPRLGPRREKNPSQPLQASPKPKPTAEEKGKGPAESATSPKKPVSHDSKPVSEEGSSDEEDHQVMVSSKLLKKIYKKLDTLEAQVEVNHQVLESEMVLMKSTFERLITQMEIYFGFNSPRNRSPYPENRFPADAFPSPSRRPETGGPSNPPQPQPQPHTPPPSPKPSPPKTDVPKESQEENVESDHES